MNARLCNFSHELAVWEQRESEAERRFDAEVTEYTALLLERGTAGDTIHFGSGINLSFGAARLIADEMDEAEATIIVRHVLHYMADKISAKELAHRLDCHVHELATACAIHHAKAKGV